MGDQMIVPICSNRPRPSTHSNRTHGNQWWTRDVYHAACGGRTFCGQRTVGWLKMDAKRLNEALADPNFCERCAGTRKAKP